MDGSGSESEQPASGVRQRQGHLPLTANASPRRAKRSRSDTHGSGPPPGPFPSLPWWTKARGAKRTNSDSDLIHPPPPASRIRLSHHHSLPRAPARAWPTQLNHPPTHPGPGRSGGAHEPNLCAVVLHCIACNSGVAGPPPDPVTSSTRAPSAPAMGFYLPAPAGLTLECWTRILDQAGMMHSSAQGSGRGRQAARHRSGVPLPLLGFGVSKNGRVHWSGSRAVPTLL